MAFEACLRLGSVTRAAEELSLAQPTVSGLLRKLSETVGEPVLRPRAGRMEPTDAGLELADLCKDFLDCLDRYDARRSRIPAPKHLCFHIDSSVAEAGAGSAARPGEAASLRNISGRFRAA